jgi:hypothetical protein
VIAVSAHARDRDLTPVGGATTKSGKRDFSLVCRHCRSLSIRFDACDVNLLASVVRCGACNSARGTFRDLQVLANSNRRDLFDV